MKKTLITILATVLVCCCAVGGTLAWLMDKTDTVTNTFTVGDIEIELAETTGEFYKMIPGNTIAKDPKVSVLAESEACWLFVQVTKSANFDTYLTYGVRNGWNELADDGDGNALTTVYYRTVTAEDAKNGISYYLLEQGTDTYANGYVTVKSDVTAAQLETAETTQPTLAFTAYAVQKDNVADAAAAWNIAINASNP
jgi:predicted ribosomally synthesized peptide with SipW-like signal peptide